ncbi:MAG: hypothetical protein ACI9SC_001932 [Gammaproteobacteria bacterium]|jgi:hypothetical protein
MEIFNWHSDTITESTLINRSYKNTQNVRRFFKSRCGDQFKFNRDFMQWMKEAEGKTMADAIGEWLNRQSER